jgi:hypothetical protein
MMNLIYLLNFNGFGENNLIIDFSQLMLINIHPDYKRRLSIEDTIKKFNAFTYRDGIISDSNFGNLVENISTNMSEFIKELRLNTQYLKKLTANLTP